ncbi:alpha-ribazole phosphatase [Clostridiales bacterium oral taxon 876 str. F0540]|nr:alpha-ribazole phosphatase [Clostridiales bacterium oral taxon 876 str. F0540]
MKGKNFMQIYLLRHGETEENKSRFYYGKLDVSLNDTGIVQSRKAGELLKEIKFDSIYISDRKRTRETAEIALNNKGLNLIADKRINEIDFGKFEGKNYEQIQREFPSEYEMWNNNWKEFAPPGGESYRQFYNRIKEFLEDILHKEQENVLIVTHGGVIRTIYCCVLEGNLDLYWKFSSKNCDISIIKYEYGNLFIDSISHVK